MVDSLIYDEKVMEPGECLRTSNTDVLFIPVKFLKQLWDSGCFTPDIITALEEGDTWADGIVMTLLFSFLNDGDNSEYLAYDVLVCNIRLKRIIGVSTADWELNECKTLHSYLEVLDNHNVLWVRYPMVQHHDGVDFVPRLVDDHWVEPCMKMLGCVSVRGMLRQNLRKNKKSHMGGLIKKALESQQIQNLENDRERGIQSLDDIELDDFEL
jgi:hypothetical protein